MSSSLPSQDRPRPGAGQPLVRVTWEPAGISWSLVLAAAVVAAGVLVGLWWILKPSRRGDRPPRQLSRPDRAMVASKEARAGRNGDRERPGSTQLMHRTERRDETRVAGGAALPERDVVEVDVLFPAEAAAALESAARRRGLTMGEMIRRLVGDFLARGEQPAVPGSR